MVHIDAVFRTASALCSNKHTVDDLVQTAFLKAFENFGSFKKGTNCKAWLLRILRNTWFDHLRHVKVVDAQLPLTEEIVEDKPKDQTVWSNAKDMLENFSDEQIIKALTKLPDDQRLTLFLIDVEGLSQQEVARITDVAVGTVKSRTHRARTELKNELSSYAKQMGLKGGEK